MEDEESVSRCVCWVGRRETKTQDQQVKYCTTSLPVHTTTDKTELKGTFFSARKWKSLFGQIKKVKQRETCFLHKHFVPT